MTGGRGRGGKRWERTVQFPEHLTRWRAGRVGGAFKSPFISLITPCVGLVTSTYTYLHPLLMLGLSQHYHRVYIRYMPSFILLLFALGLCHMNINGSCHRSDSHLLAVRCPRQRKRAHHHERRPPGAGAEMTLCDHLGLSSKPGGFMSPSSVTPSLSWSGREHAGSSTRTIHRTARM